MSIKNISITILTKNSERHLEAVLKSLHGFGEVMVYDTGSTDRTREIVDSCEYTTWVEGFFDGFGLTHNRASSLAQHDWILSIDSDELLSMDLKQEIEECVLDKQSVYAISRRNFYRGREIKSCGWSPDYQVKLYNRTATKYSQAAVHETVMAQGLKKVFFKHQIDHFPYASIEDFLYKMQSYSSLFAQQYQGKRTSSTAKAIFRGLYTFLRCYFLQRGIFEGSQGFEIAIYNAITTYYKYLKLRDANRMEEEKEE